MPKFAKYFSESSSLTHVTGWYDTDTLQYSSLPDEKSLIEVTDDQWHIHFSYPDGWTVVDGEIIPPRSQ